MTTSYSDVFGGSTVQPSDVGFRAVSLSANLVTVWPAFATTGNQCARIMKVTPTVGSLTVSLPDATLTTAGMDVLFDNPSSFSFTVLDFMGGVVATVAAGQVKYIYLSDSSTQAGTWRTTIFGVGSSTLDAASLAGYGVKALSNTINTAAVVTNISGNTTISLADRSKVFVWTGGTGTLTLMSTTGSTSDFAIEVHNQGSGVLTVVTTGGVLIDGSSTIALSINESCFIHMGATDWYTVGRGRNMQFNFTQLNKTVTGGTVALTLTEASNVVQKYTGALVSNQIVNQPAVVQVYYVSNSTTGAYTLTFGCVGGGTSVSVVQGQAAILFCDGTNIINANTSLSGGISSIVFGNGSATTPSAAFGTSTTGFYVTGSNEIGVTNNGVYAGKFTALGYQVSGTGAVALQAVSSGGQADIVADRPAGNSGGHRWRTAGIDRWTLEANNVAEGGSNAGSNFALDAYSDAGALLGTALTVNRATQVVTLTQPPVFDATNVSNTIAPQTHAATSKVTPVDADEMPVADSAASFGLKKLTWANLKATILTWLQGTVFPDPGAIGGTTPAAGSFTTLSVSGINSLGFNGGTGYLQAGVNVNANGLGNYLAFNAITGNAFTWTINQVSVANLSSTGLAVTGALSATGNTTITQSDGRFIAGDTVGRAIFANSGVTSYAVAYGASHATNANQFQIITNGNVTTQDASGNLGLGVVPSAWRSGAHAFQSGVFTSLSTQANGATNLMFGGYESGTNIFSYSTTGDLPCRYAQVGGNHTWLTAPSGTAGNPITWTQVMTLDASGNLLVGATSAIFGEKVTVSNSSSSAYNLTALSTSSAYTGGGVISGSSATTNTGSFRSFTGYSSSGINFQVLANGNVTNTNNSYGAISDIKLKENITDTTPKLAGLMRVRIVNYTLKTDPAHKQIGVIAQELESVFPGMIEETPDRESQKKTREVDAVMDAEGVVVTPSKIEEYEEMVDIGTVTKSVKYSVFVPMLIKAMQEQQAMIVALTDRIAILEQK